MRDIDTPIETLIDDLRDVAQPMPTALVYRLSDPLEEDLSIFEANWEGIPVERRRQFVARLADIGEESYEFNFEKVASFASEDLDAEVREHAVKALWTSDTLSTMWRLIDLLRSDPAEEVRARAATGLGPYILRTELEELSEEITSEATDLLVDTFANEMENQDLRRHCLEAVSSAMRDDVLELISEAADSPDVKMRASAVYAMGRNSHEQWSSDILKALGSTEPEMRFQACQAAGEMLLVDAVPQLITLAQSSDIEIRQAAIWALGEIGGDQATDFLQRLADDEDDPDLLEEIEEALQMASLSVGELAMFVFSEDDLDADSPDDDLLPH
ncbi:MAG: HEAT repeat domain-containing protein [Chloroflexi bacterium]|nr:HEAT repeat domain-containing protein [Chloroflexota bacterium]